MIKSIIPRLKARRQELLHYCCKRLPPAKSTHKGSSFCRPLKVKEKNFNEILKVDAPLQLNKS